MINLFLGICMLGIISLIVWSYIFDPNNGLVVSFSKKKFMLTLAILILITIYLLSTGIYHSFL